MAEWIETRGWSQRLSVSAAWPDQEALDGAAIIVANAARDHERAVAWALAHGAHTLVEKPIALTAPAAESLARAPRHHESRLAAAQVFLYARYFENFCAAVTAAGPVEAVDLDWADPAQEERYGESKQYDPGLPVFSDWLPHVVPIVGLLLHAVPDSCRATRFSRGGAQCDLEIDTGHVRCTASIERDASERRRIVRAQTAGRTYQLDFSAEPGTISWPDETRVADPDWHTRPRPLARMLTAFLAWAGGAGKDERLETHMALQACRFSDDVAAQYRRDAAPRIAAGLASPEPVDRDLRYALAEVLQADGRLPAGELDRRIRALKQWFSRPEDADRAHALCAADEPFMLLRTLAGGAPS